MDGFPAGLVVVVPGATSHDTMARASESAQLLHIDMDQLAGMATAVAIGRFRWLQARQPVQSDAGKDGAHRGGRQPELGRDARRGEPQPPQAPDRSLDIS